MGRDGATLGLSEELLGDKRERRTKNGSWMAQERQTRKDVSALLFQARKGRNRKGEVNSWIKTLRGREEGNIKDKLEAAASKRRESQP